MSRLIVHMACPYARVAVANALAGLSGRDDEHSIRLESVPGKPAKEWEGIKGYPQGRWQGASQRLEASFVQAMLADGVSKKPESYYVAWDEATGSPVDTNLPVWPADTTFAAFLEVLGCVRFAMPGIPTGG